jgi:hypothetical protein
MYLLIIKQNHVNVHHVYVDKVMLVHNIIILVIVDVIRQYLNTSNHKRKFILFLAEKSLGKKIVCLSVRRIKKTFPIENTEISVFVLNYGSVVVGGGRVECLPPKVKGTHFRGQKNISYFLNFFGFIFLHKGLRFSQKTIFL